MRAFTGRRSERGSTIVIVAVSMAALLAVGALAVDMGMLMKARSDAQRVADAAALAGAAAYLKQKPPDALDSARHHALEYAARNYIGGTYVDVSDTATTMSGTRQITTSKEAVVVVIPDEEKVRVIVRRTTTGTLFARVFGVQTVPVSAKAAAVASNANTSNLCIKPFALPDIWADADNDNKPANRLEDIGKNATKPDENWRYDPSKGDSYRQYGDETPGPNPTQTGWGSSYRNNSTSPDNPGKLYWDDYGRQVKLKVTSSHDVPSPSFFQAWSLPGYGKGGAAYRANINTCRPVEINLTSDYDFDDTMGDDSKPGNMVGPTWQGMNDLINQDPDACWAEIPDPNHAGYVRGEVRKKQGNNCSLEYPGWQGSPRVITVPLFSPEQITSGRTKLKFNNLGVFFIQEQKNQKDPVTANFLYYAKGTGAPGSGGPLIKKLRLVE
jgi:putative Flp pilus-assembly TadE/G-like protein